MRQDNSKRTAPLLSPKTSTVSRWLFCAYAIVCLAAIFYLPYRVPLAPSVSDSYLFGYNNRAGIVLLLIAVTIGAIWTRGLNLKLCVARPSEPVPRKFLVVSIVAVLAGCLAMYMLAGRFGGFGESSYEIDRAWLLSQGKTPYVDFEWPFGVALLYGPLLISRTISVNIVQAYYIFWIINCLLGTLLLFAVINLIDYPSKSKKAIYLLLFGSWFLSILNMGTHYTLVRYACPLYFLLLIQNSFKRGGVRGWIRAGYLGIAFTIVLFLISPEVAIAFAWACICIFIVSPHQWNSGVLIGFSAWLVAMAAVFWASLRLHILDTVRASGGGADSFPIAPAPHFLLFFVALFLCACYLYQRFTSQRGYDNTIGMIAFSIPMIAAALGRGDPGHVLLNGLGIFIASMFYLSNQEIAWKWYKAAFIFLLILLSGISGIWFYQQPLRRCGLNLLSESGSDSPVRKSLLFLGRKYIAYFASPAKKSKWEKELEDFQHLSVPTTVDLSTIYPTWRGAFLAPFGYKPNGFGTYLSTQVDYGYFEDIENANTVSAIQRKVAELRSQPERALLLPDQFDRICQFDVPEERQKIGILFDSPYIGRAVHPESIRQPICQYIHSRYRLEQAPALENFGYGLWVPASVNARNRVYGDQDLSLALNHWSAISDK